MSTLDIQDVLDGISELFSMIIFIFGLWHDQIFEELRKGWSIANEIEGDLLLPLFLFMEASLGCDVYVCNFGIALYWMLVVMTLTFTDNPKFLFLYYLQSVFVLLSLKNENLHLLIPVVFVSCGHGMQSTVFHELHIHLIPGTSNFILAVPNIRSMLLL